MWHRVRELGQGILQLLYPACCAACQQPLSIDDTHFCSTCRAALVRDATSSCPRCAATVGPFSQVAEGCSRCRNQGFRFAAVLRLGPYEEPLRDLILRMKHASGEMLAEMLGQLWAEQSASRLSAWQVQVVIPVPLHWRRRWARGYNQSAVLAEALARRLELPCRPGWLRRIRHTPMQTAPSVADRRDNVRGAFRAVSRGLAGQRVLLVDDVMTTGSTADEAVRTLRQAGAEKVVVAVLARAPGQ